MLQIIKMLTGRFPVHFLPDPIRNRLPVCERLEFIVFVFG
jgi:hypothetical protein